MKKPNKYLYGWKLLVDYNEGGGWEYECFELTWKDAQAQLRAYQENCPRYSVKLVKGRETNIDWLLSE